MSCRCAEIQRLDPLRHFRGCMERKPLPEGDLPEPSQLRKNVSAFHEMIGQRDLTRPEVPDEKVVRLRLRLIAEEFFELLDAALASPKRYDTDLVENARSLIDCAVAESFVSVNLPDFVDALADLRYVIVGTDLAFGVDGDKIDAVVHDANMRKLGGERDEYGKIQKPEGWSPPDIAGELLRQTYAADAPEMPKKKPYVKPELKDLGTFKR